MPKKEVMSAIEALILGIIQGLTEFLPVSSSGHIELGKVILGQNELQDPVLFSIVVHAATALSTIVIFRKEILELILGVLAFKWNEETQYAAKIVVSMLPVFVVGVFFEDQIDALFTGQIVLVGSMLLLTGGLLMLSERIEGRGTDVGYGQAAIIGLAQACAILPGISRSGATISTALLTGVERAKAAKFSFLMVLPPILGATLLKLKDYLGGEAGAGEPLGMIPLATGFVAAFIAGLLACQWMMRLVKESRLVYFAIYCFVVGMLAIGSNWWAS